MLSARVSPGEGGEPDPESFGAMLPHFQEACQRVVTGLGGHVGKMPLAVIPVQEFTVRLIVADDDVQVAIAIQVG